MASEIANIDWRILSGKDNWKDLLNPLNEELRQYLIQYGERVQATYDGIDDDTSSKMYGFPRFPKDELFSKVGLAINNPYKYTVTNYLYATSECDLPKEYPGDWAQKGKSSWIGYVAVASPVRQNALGRKDILICWRGSPSAADWFGKFDSTLVTAPKIFGDSGREPKDRVSKPKGNTAVEPKVHNGIYSVYKTDSPTSKYNRLSAQQQVLEAVRKQLELYKNEEISITVAGHNVGGALAILNAVDIARNIVKEKKYLVTAFIFGSPKVGDYVFQDAFEQQKNLHLLNIKNVSDDIVPPLPNGNYAQVGIPFQIGINSPYVRPDLDNPDRCHNDLEYYLHGVTIWERKPLVVDHDFALLNKHLDVLRDEFEIPPYWWAPVSNKGMVQQPDGHWELVHYVPDPPAAAAAADDDDDCDAY